MFTYEHFLILLRCLYSCVLLLKHIQSTYWWISRFCFKNMMEQWVVNTKSFQISQRETRRNIDKTLKRRVEFDFIPEMCLCLYLLVSSLREYLYLSIWCKWFCVMVSKVCIEWMDLNWGSQKYSNLYFNLISLSLCCSSLLNKLLQWGSSVRMGYRLT